MHSVGIAVHEHTMPYEVAIAAEVFGVDRSDLSCDGDWYRLSTHTAEGGPSPFLPGVPAYGFGQVPGLDTVVVPATHDIETPPSPEYLAALRAAHQAGRRIVSLCTGAFVLAAAGLLDGRSATTHWMHADALAGRHPLVNMRADVLYTDDGQVLTSAGKTAALDLCLHLVRTDHGAAAAGGLARRLVAPVHRPGGQAQYIPPPTVPCAPDSLGAALEWARARLDRPLAVADLARRAGLSTRQLVRRMRVETGTTPLVWLHGQRVRLSQELLESTDATVEQIAARCGMGTATTLRRHFHRVVGVSPLAYRATFRASR
ncbi:transcriptional regulator GlxA family with amidase domain [Nocardiopsis sp. Huas11]|uniref:GlxA family transcriptional regulator n=1 Tax=Nocardiopsis sp. Huas11 TaxID=2183912 RepID=UPI000EAEFBCD|nr:helix-turn-helix domain-containing protein [Nocardiopsis sp. Huas11]RKS08724.1 transcriptional regulator GlxA family with amidase domain [Nocardiopsis sp. Huas11]